MELTLDALQAECVRNVQEKLAVTSVEMAIEALGKLSREDALVKLEEVSKKSNEPLNSLACLCHVLTGNELHAVSLQQAVVNACIIYFDSALHGDKDVTKEALQVTLKAYQAMALLLKHDPVYAYVQTLGERYERFLKGSINLINWCETWKPQVNIELHDQGHSDLAECLKELSLATIIFFTVILAKDKGAQSKPNTTLKTCLDSDMSKDWVIVLCRKASLKFSWIKAGVDVSFRNNEHERIQGTIVEVKEAHKCTVRTAEAGKIMTVPMKFLEIPEDSEDHSQQGECVDYTPYLDLLDILISSEFFETWFNDTSERAQQKIVSKVSSCSSCLASYPKIKELTWFKQSMEKRKDKREERRKKRKRQRDGGESKRKAIPTSLTSLAAENASLIENLDSGAEALLRLWESKDVIQEKTKNASLLTNGELDRLLVSARNRTRNLKPSGSLLYTDPVSWGGIAPAETMATAAAIEGVLILGRLLEKDPQILTKQNSILRYSTLAASGSVTYALSEVAKRLSNGDLLLATKNSEESLETQQKEAMPLWDRGGKASDKPIDLTVPTNPSSASPFKPDSSSIEKKLPATRQTTEVIHSASLPSSTTSPLRSKLERPPNINTANLKSLQNKEAILTSTSAPEKSLTTSAETRKEPSQAVVPDKPAMKKVEPQSDNEDTNTESDEEEVKQLAGAQVIAI